MSGSEEMEELVTILRAAASTGSKEAEATLAAAAESRPSELVANLAEVAGSKDPNLPEVKMAFILLKRLLGDGAWHGLPDATKARLQSVLLSALSGEGTLAPACLASIARGTFPEQPSWLRDVTAAATSPESPAQLRSGALLCLEEMGTGAGDEELEPLASLFLPAFPPLFHQAERFPDADVLRAGRLLNSLGNSFRMGSDESLVESVLLPALPTFAPAWIRLLRWDPEHVQRLRGALIPLTAWTEALSAQMAADYGPELVTALAQLFEEVSAFHLRELEEGNMDSEEGGEERSEAAEVAYVGTDILQSLILSGDFQLGARLESLLASLLRHSHVSSATAERWMREPESFVEEEEAEGLGSSLRAATRDLISDFLGSDDEETEANLRAFARVSLAHLSQASELMGKGNPHWWAYVEATLSLLALGAEALRLLPPEDATQLLSALSGLPGSLGPLGRAEPPFPLLRGQLLYLLARFAPELAEEGRKALLQELSRCLDKDSQPILRLSALKAAKALADYVVEKALPASLLKPSLAGLLKSLCSLIGEGASEQTFYLLLPALEALVKVDLDEGAAAEAKLRPLATALLIKYSGDPLIPGQAADLLRLLATQERCRASVVACVVPTCLSVIRTPNAPNIPIHLPAVALSTLTAVLKGCGSPLPEIFLRDAFPLVASLAAAEGEQDVLAAGRECLRAFLAVAPSQTLAWRGEDGTSAVEALVRVCLHLLGPAAPEMAGSYVNRLLYLLLQSALEETRPHLDAILSAALARAAQTQLASVRQTCLTILAYAAQADLHTTLAFLAAQKSPREANPGDTALHFLVSELEERLTSTLSEHDRKVCGLALAGILEAGMDPSLNSPPLQLLRQGSEPLLLRLAKVALTEWRLQCPSLRGGPTLRANGGPGPLSLQEALQSLASELGDLWEDSDEEKEDGDPLAAFESGDALEAALKQCMGQSEFAALFITSLEESERAALKELLRESSQ